MSPQTKNKITNMIDAISHARYTGNNAALHAAVETGKMWLKNHPSMSNNPYVISLRNKVQWG